MAGGLRHQAHTMVARQGILGWKDHRPGCGPHAGGHGAGAFGAGADWGREYLTVVRTPPTDSTEAGPMYEL